MLVIGNWYKKTPEERDISNRSWWNHKVENNSVKKRNIKDALNVALCNQDNVLLELVFDYLNVPKELTLKEKLCYYYLLER